MEANNGGPAFPTAPIENRNGDVQYGADGMTLRAYIATAAMQGFVASTGVVGGPVPTSIDIARWSVEQADALLAELEAK